MAAEMAHEITSASASESLPRGSRYVIADGEHQATEIIRGKAHVGRGVKASYTLEVPLEHTSSDIMDVFVKGCGASEAAYEPLRSATAQLGKAGLTVGSPRGTVIGDLLSPQDIFHAERYQARAVVAAMEDVEKRYGLSRASLKGHSMGGRDAAAAAEGLPDNAESVTFISAAGLEKHNLLKLAARVHPFLTRDAGPNFNLLREEFEELKTVLQFGWHALSNPLRMGVDVISISHADIRPRVLALGDKGIRTAILDMQGDALITNLTVEHGIGRHVDVYRWHPNPEFGHVAPQTHALEVALELHSIDEELFPDDVRSPRQFAVKAMGRSVAARREEPEVLSLVS